MIMAYTIIGVLLIFFICLYAIKSESLSQEKTENKDLQKEVQYQKKATAECFVEVNKMQQQQRNDFKAVVKKMLVIHNYDSSDEMVETIFNHLNYVGNIKEISDLLSYDFDYIVKVCSYAKDGLLDTYVNYFIDDERPFILYNGKEEERIFLTEEQNKQICSKDYSFIFSLYED
jgi:hypothetical protein